MEYDASGPPAREIKAEYLTDAQAAEIRAECRRREAAQDAECLRRIPELSTWSYGELVDCAGFLDCLDDLDGEYLTDLLDECEYFLDGPGRGWIEDEHGGAIFIPHLGLDPEDD